MYHINTLCEDQAETQASDGSWVKARPINYKYASYWQRIRDTWFVLTGKADAVVWTEQ